MRYYTNELKRLLRDHPFGLSLGEVHRMASEYGIPSHYSKEIHFRGEVLFKAYTYSHEAAIAIAEGLRDG